MMNEFRTAKEAYDQTPIPQELNERVQAGIRQGSEAYRSAHRRVALRRPQTTALAQQVSQEIQERVDAKIAEGEKIIADYKEAFLATGGTEEQWAEKDNTVSVTYDIKSQTDTTVSFVVDSYVSIASAYQEQVYYNLDLAANREITLADLLGENWVEICNESIRTQMAEVRTPLCSSLRTWAALPRWTRPLRSISTKRATPWWCSPNTPWPSAPWAMWNLRSRNNAECSPEHAPGNIFLGVVPGWAGGV